MYALLVATSLGLSLFLGGCFKNAEKLGKQRADFSEKRNAHLINVQFSGTVKRAVPIEFRPLILNMKALPGNEYEVFYRFTNHSAQDIDIVAAHAIKPEAAAPHFAKLVCFCFEEQTLKANASVDMPVKFKIARNLPKEIDSIELSYVIHAVRKVSKDGQKTPAKSSKG